MTRFVPPVRVMGESRKTPCGGAGSALGEAAAAAAAGGAGAGVGVRSTITGLLCVRPCFVCKRRGVRLAVWTGGQSPVQEQGRKSAMAAGQPNQEVTHGAMGVAAGSVVAGSEAGAGAAGACRVVANSRTGRMSG